MTCVHTEKWNLIFISCSLRFVWVPLILILLQFQVIIDMENLKCMSPFRHIRHELYVSRIFFEIEEVGRMVLKKKKKVGRTFLSVLNLQSLTLAIILFQQVNCLEHH